MNILNQGHYSVLFIIVVVFWLLPWKGYSLWLSVKENHKWWFIALLILNTFAILEIYYVFYVAKKTPQEIMHTIKATLKKLPWCD